MFDNIIKKYSLYFNKNINSINDIEENIDILVPELWPTGFDVYLKNNQKIPTYLERTDIDDIIYDISKGIYYLESFYYSNLYDENGKILIPYNFISKSVLKDFQNFIIGVHKNPMHPENYNFSDFISFYLKSYDDIGGIESSNYFGLFYALPPSDTISKNWEIITFSPKDFIWKIQ